MNALSKVINKLRVNNEYNRMIREQNNRNKMIEIAVARVCSFNNKRYSGKLLAFGNNWVSQVNQYTGDLRETLIRLPESVMFDKIGYYLRAYRDTNEGVLTEEQSGELERLIQIFD